MRNIHLREQFDTEHYSDLQSAIVIDSVNLQDSLLVK